LETVKRTALIVSQDRARVFGCDFERVTEQAHCRRR
jgi:hypothetical protein